MKSACVRRCLLCVVCAVWSAFAYAQSGQLVFDETVHDFGQVLESDGPLSCTFTARTKGSSSVTEKSVTSSCGCTVAKWSHDPVAPGGKTFIKVTFSNEDGAHPFDKTLTVNVTGDNRPIVLHIRGKVQKVLLSDAQMYPAVYCGAFALEADRLKCGNLEQGGEKGELCTVANLSSADIKLGFADVSDGLSVEVKPNPIPAKGHATMYYTVVSRSDKWGYNDYCATPVVNGKSSGKKLIVRAFTADRFSSLSKEEKARGSRPIFEQSTFSFGHKKQGAKITASFTCQNKGKAALVVHKVDSDCGGAVSDPIPSIAPGACASFNISLDTSGLPKGEALVIITLTTNSPVRPIVNLYLAGWID